MLAQLLRRSAHRLPANLLRHIANFWRPFRGAGIRITNVSDDYCYLRVELRLRWYNKNYVGTHFGGSLYAMTDPFYMMMLINNLGSDYVVWDKAAEINFIKPGRDTVSAEFQFSPQEIEQIRQQLEQQPKLVFQKPVQIIDQQGELVAQVNKTLYVRKKNN